MEIKMDDMAVIQHRQRLFNLLPRVFAQQPKGTAIATVIDAMAKALAILDQDINRTQRDHWLDLAHGDTDSDEEVSALENLGRLLGIIRFKEEATDDYRQRIQLTAKVLTRGSTTPSSLLEVAIVTLGAEPCPHQTTPKDATIAIGVPLGTVKKCPKCNDSSNPSLSCPNDKVKVLEAVLIDNPLQQTSFNQLLKANLPPQVSSDEVSFTITSHSLMEDVPEIRLKALDKDIQYPTLKNKDTGELMLYAGDIKLGQELSISPWLSHTETDDPQFDTHDNVTAHAWLKQSPFVSAVLKDTDGKSHSVNDKIYYFIDAKSKFSSELNNSDNDVNEPRFDEDTKFLSFEQKVRSPRIRVDKNEWLYGIYTKKDILALVESNKSALYNEAPEDKDNTPPTANLTLLWWIRQPATFHLRILRNEWVKSAEQLDATLLFATWLQHAKAAGVKATLDFPQPVLTETLKIDESLALKTTQRWQDDLQLDDKPPQWQIENKA
jgi:hypothetical protein